MLYTNANISTIYQALVSHYHWRAQDFFKMAGGGGRAGGGGEQLRADGNPWKQNCMRKN